MSNRRDFPLKEQYGKAPVMQANRATLAKKSPRLTLKKAYERRMRRQQNR